MNFLYQIPTDYCSWKTELGNITENKQIKLTLVTHIVFSMFYVLTTTFDCHNLYINFKLLVFVNSDLNLLLVY